jgi:ribonuclease H2 subunit A
MDVNTLTTHTPVAKVMRDRLLENWKFTDDGPVGSSAGSSSFSSMDGTAVHPLSRDFGSGYPSDPKCKAWMEELHDPVFGYNDFVRFSWAPTKARLEEKGVPVLFRADLDDDEDDDLQSKKGMANFLSGTKKRKRMGYFDTRNIEVVTNLR